MAGAGHPSGAVAAPVLHHQGLLDHVRKLEVAGGRAGHLTKVTL